MTKRPSLDEYLEARKDYADDNGVVYKGVVSEKAYDPDKRTARFVMSSEASDRMSDVVKQDGIDLKNFMKNPVALAYHRHDAPIGMWKNVEVITNGRPKRTEGDLYLHAEGVSERTDEISRIMAVGGLKAVSIGFIPKELDFIRDEDGVWNGGFSIPEAELLECSIVSIPAQPAALMKAVEGNTPLLAETLEYILDTYCEKTSGGLFVRKEFEQAYDLVKENKIKGKTADAAADQAESQISVAIDIDTKDAEAKVDGLLEKLRKGLGEIFGAPITEKSGEVTLLDDVSEYSEIVFKTDGKGNVTVVEWPEKALADIEILAKEFGWEPSEDGETSSVEIKTSNQVAVYRPVKKSDDGEIAYFELVEVKDIEPEPEAPVLVKGSRAQAEARIAKLKASLISQGALT